MIKTLILFITLTLIYGCGNDDSLAKKAGNKVGETLTDFASGVGEGVDEKMLVIVNLSEPLKAKGLSKTISKSLGLDKGFSVYLISQKTLSSKLIAKAIDKSGQEIGRVVVSVEFAADDAKYIIFKFNDELDMQLVKSFNLAIKE